jgi:hypothetical protein
MNMQATSSWRFITDGVMGGRSTGVAHELEESGMRCLRMTGQVSTANNGGFIQIRFDLSAPPAPGCRAVRLTVRGNEERYFLHLRTQDAARPWHFYRAGFETHREWRHVNLPFDSFTPADPSMVPTFRPEQITSVALAAFGREHPVAIDLQEWQFA